MNDLLLVLASRNIGKVSEIKELLSGFDIDVRWLDDFGPIPDVIEDGKTFEDNAYKKAHFTAKVLGFPALADDSGLVVEALNGAPGVYSARYAGDKASDEDRNSKLLYEMRGIDNRNAYFETIIAIAVPSGPALIYEGRCYGEIATETKGENGFGYDPLFFYPPMKKTFAQMTSKEKNSVSHRGMAMKELKNEFNKVILWIKQRLAEEPFGDPSSCMHNQE
jgi:XTP/dITP diphosphohydrolase